MTNETVPAATESSKNNKPMRVAKNGRYLYRAEFIAIIQQLAKKWTPGEGNQPVYSRIVRELKEKHGVLPNPSKIKAILADPAGHTLPAGYGEDV